MKKVYKSKVDWWLGLLLIYPVYKSVVSILAGEWMGYVVLATTLLLVFFFSKTTRYLIEGDKLIVKSAWIVYEKIDIGAIRRIERSGSVLSAPALSLDRIVVKYNKFDEVYLSPKDKQAFARDLQSVNPAIEISL